MFRVWLIVVALFWAWLHSTWHHSEHVDGDREDAVRLSHRLLFAGLTVPEGGTPGSSGKDGNPSIFGHAGWAAPEKLLAAREALRKGRLVVIKQFLDPDAAWTLRNEVGRLFSARGDWTDFVNGNLTKVNHTEFEEALQSNSGLNCSYMSQKITASGSRSWVRYQEHALPGSLGSAAMAQVAGKTPPMLATLNRIMRSEEMNALVSWLFDRVFVQPETNSGAESVAWELKVTRWRPKLHWAAPHEDSVRPRSGSAGAQRFAAFTMHLCDTRPDDLANQGYGGAFLWCSPPARVPCAFNQLLVFGLGSDAMHAVEPVVPNRNEVQASSRWTIQAWASDRGGLASHSTGKKEEGNYLHKYAASFLAYVESQKLSWYPTHSAVPLEIMEPHVIGN